MLLIVLIAYHYEIVPETCQGRGVAQVLLELEGAREECDEIGRTEVARIYGLILEVRV